MSDVPADVLFPLSLDFLDNEALEANNFQIELHIMVDNVSTDTSTWRVIRNESYPIHQILSSCITTLIILRWRNRAKIWDVHDQAKYASKSATLVRECQSVGDLSNVQCSYTRPLSMATVIQALFQLWTGTRSRMDWKKAVLSVFDIDPGFNSTRFLSYQTVNL